MKSKWDFFCCCCNNTKCCSKPGKDFFLIGWVIFIGQFSYNRTNTSLFHFPSPRGIKPVLLTPWAVGTSAHAFGGL